MHNKAGVNVSPDIISCRAEYGRMKNIVCYFCLGFMVGGGGEENIVGDKIKFPQWIFKFIP